MLLNVGCPSCGRVLLVPDHAAGRPMVCNACGARFIAPGESTAPVAPSTEPTIEWANPPVETASENQPWPKSPPPPPVPAWRRFRESLDTARVMLIAGGVMVLLLLIWIGYLAASRHSSDDPVEKNETAPLARAKLPAPLLVTTSPASQPAATEPVASLQVAPQLPGPDAITDDRIGRAIERGANWLLGRFDTESHQLRPNPNSEQHNAMNALCVYALLQASQTIADPRLDIRKPTMRGFLTKLGKLKMEKHVETYGRGLRATALAVYDRPEDREALQADVDWLVQTHKDGAYGYGDAPASTGGAWDHSNTQYGQLGVWSGVDAGIDVPASYWQTVQDHWAATQNADGSWSYGSPGGTGTLSMTAAGLASLFVAHDHLDPPELADKVDEPAFPAVLQNALDWCEQSGRVLRPESNPGYTLYGVERIGLASGLKFIGDVDWYQEHAKLLLKQQSPDGSWGDEIQTSYVMLFLARGRHPILINKLRFDGHWANRWRDAANLTRFASHELEKPFNWQVVPSDRSWTAWADSPLLYLASHEPPKLNEDEVDNLRRFVEAGGLLFTHADGGRPAFNEFAHDLAHRLFPHRAMKPLPADHAVYSMLYHLDPAPPLEGVSNGVRLLMVHSPKDLSAAWHPKLVATHPLELRMGLNLFLYAAGKSDYRNRILETPLPDPAEATGGVIKFARLRYGEDEDDRWNPEPEAWRRFAKWFALETNCKLDVAERRASALNTDDKPVIVHLTGVEAFELPETEVEALRRYVSEGGTLFIDPAGGSATFTESAMRLLGRAFPDKAVKPLVSSDGALGRALYGANDASRGALRLFAGQKLGSVTAPAMEMFTVGKGRVVLSRLDVTAAVLGTRTWGIYGYEPEYARRVVKDLVLWCAGGAPEKH